MDFPRDIAVDRRGHSYVTGEFRDVAIFGPGEANQTTLTAFNAHDLFVAEYSRSGKLVWVSQVTGPGNFGLYGIAVDDAGRAAITGLSGGSVTFAPGSGQPTTLTSDRPFAFLARYDQTGALLWAVRADLGGKGVVDSAGNSYVVGAGTFESTDGTALTLTGAPGVATTFIVKYDSRGKAHLGARAEFSTCSDLGCGSFYTRSVAIDRSGGMYLGRRDVNNGTSTSVRRFGADGAFEWERLIVSPNGRSADGIDIVADRTGWPWIRAAALT
jgi:hypothetical protein